jgi:nucleoside-diphosphate-sugar epimerase
MRIAIIGGTAFIGRRTVEVLTERGDDVMVVHRGKTEPTDFPRCEHLHGERAAFASVAGDVAAFRPDAVVDTTASTAVDRDAVLPHLPDVPVVLLSSMDVYRFFELLHADDDSPLPVPFDESGELRRGRYPYAGRGIGEDDYEKLDVEPAYLQRGATVLRLAMVYGPRDPQTREEFVLRRVRAGRRRIPLGPAGTIFTRIHVDDAASAILAAIDRPDAATGQVFNVGEAGSYSMRAWIRLILAAAGHDTDLVRVADDLVPPDLRLTRALSQHFVVSSAKAMSLLDWTPGPTAAAVASSVQWHLENPPADRDAPDFAADEAALASVG